MTFSSLHANAIPLYTSFGLDAWWPLLSLYGDAGSVQMPQGWSVVAATADEAGQAERAWTGADRVADYRAWAGRPNGTTLAASYEGELMAVGSRAGPADDFGIVHLAISPAAGDTAVVDGVLAALALSDLPGLILGRAATRSCHALVTSL